MLLSFRFPVPPLFNTPSNSKHKPFTSIYYNRDWNSGNESIPNSVSFPRFPKFVVAASDVAAGEEEFPEGLRRELMPKHVAVIMDGNRRWAQDRGVPARVGHSAGGKRLKHLTELCEKWGVKVLSVFAFSTENWTRSHGEIGSLMSLIEEISRSVLEEWIREGMKISVIGDLSKLPKSLLKFLTETMEASKANSRFHLILALNYSGQCDITQACQTIAHKVNDGLILPENINRSLIEQELQTKCSEFPCPDLLIRTSGEFRVSNFMLWQLAYTELYFSDVFFPDFVEAEFLEALRSYQHRQRRYGGHGYGG